MSKSYFGDKAVSSMYWGDKSVIALIMGDAVFWEAETSPTEYLTFQSDTAFSLAVTTPNWDGTLYTSTDAETWEEWSGTSISSNDNILYLRGIGNTIIGGTDALANRFNFTGATNLQCYGRIETLLDWEIAKNGTQPTMINGCYENLFYGCLALVIPPEMSAVEIPNNGYKALYKSCYNLKVSEISSPTYNIEWCIPSVDNITSVGENWNLDMIAATGGTFVEDPSVNTTYYLNIQPNINYTNTKVAGRTISGMSGRYLYAGITASPTITLMPYINILNAYDWETLPNTVTSQSAAVDAVTAIVADLVADDITQTVNVISYVGNMAQAGQLEFVVELTYRGTTAVTDVLAVAIAEIEILPFADATWQEIDYVCNTLGRASEFYNIGDTKTDNDEAWRIVGFDHDDLVDGGKSAISMVTALPIGNYRMNPANSNAGGWDGCEFRTTTLPEILPTICSAELRAVAKTVVKPTGAGSKSANIIYSNDKFWLPSMMEIIGETNASYNTVVDGEQYPYFEPVENRIISVDGVVQLYWLRTPRQNNATAFMTISSTGGNGGSGANSTRFCNLIGCCI